MERDGESQSVLAVLNPKGRDPFLDYRDGPGAYQKGTHAPVNFHAYAAATCGAFFDSTEHLISEKDRFRAVLVLIRRRTWISLEAIQRLKKAGLKVLVSWKECAPVQISRQLRSRKAIAAYAEILTIADGILSPTLEPPPRVGSIDASSFRDRLKFVPTPYPLEFSDWDYSIPPEKRSGIFLGTRSFDAEGRNHLQAISFAAELAHRFDVPRVTVINTEKKKGTQMLEALEPAFPKGVLQVVSPLPYRDYMALLAEHRIVFQKDTTSVPGQVAGDALLARSLCAGGNTVIEKVAFSELSAGASEDSEALMNLLGKTLGDDALYLKAIDRAAEIGRKKLSFAAVADELSGWSLIQ